MPTNIPVFEIIKTNHFLVNQFPSYQIEVQKFIRKPLQEFRSTVFFSIALKFINYISPSVFFMQFLAWPIFRLTFLTFRTQKRDKHDSPEGIKMPEPFGLLDSKNSIYRNCFGDINL